MVPLRWETQSSVLEVVLVKSVHKRRDLKSLLVIRLLSHDGERPDPLKLLGPEQLPQRVPDPLVFGLAAQWGARNLRAPMRRSSCSMRCAAPSVMLGLIPASRSSALRARPGNLLVCQGRKERSVFWRVRYQDAETAKARHVSITQGRANLSMQVSKKRIESLSVFAIHREKRVVALHRSFHVTLSLESPADDGGVSLAKNSSRPVQLDLHDHRRTASVHFDASYRRRITRWVGEYQKSLS